MAEAFLRRLKYDNDTLDKVKKLVRYHDERPRLTYPSVRKFITAAEVSNMENLMRLKYADLYAHTDYQWEDKIYQVETLDKMYRKIMEDGDCLSVKDLAVNGHDLMEAGIPAGPAIGEALGKLLDLVLNEPTLNDRDTLLANLERYIR